MAKVDVIVDPGAGQETICNDVLVAAATGMNPTTPGAPATAAEVIRQDGKVVKIIVSLPDGDAPGLAAAKAKIEENSGVASASAFPISGKIETWPTGFIQNETFTENGITIFFDGGANVSSAGAVGNPSPSVYSNQDTTGLHFDVRASDNDLVDIGAYSLVIDVGARSPDGNWPGLSEDQIVRFTDPQHGTIDILELLKAGFPGNYQMSGAGTPDTGVAIVQDISPISLSIVKDLTGKITFTAGASTFSTATPALLNRISSFQLSTRADHVNAETDTLYLDNADISINS